jgi:hypothetical protein
MASPRHPWLLASLILASLAGFGCNLLALPFFLMTGMDPKLPPKCRLASDDKERTVRILIMASNGLETRPEFLRVDQEICSMLARNLEKGFKDNKEKVLVVPVGKVSKYKDEHPNWRAMGPTEIGKYFDADYVIDLEIEQLTLFEPGSGNQLYRGRGTVSISVSEVSKPDEDPMYRETYTVEYPRTRGPIPVGDGNAQQFRQLFLNQLAKELSWRFTAHPTSEDISCTD